MIQTPDKPAIARAFSKKATEYESHAYVARLCCETAMHLLQRTSRLRGTWLDAGCGTGLFEEMLPRDLWPEKLLCLDIARDVLDYAAARNSSAIAAVLADVDALPFRLQPFECIILNSVLQWTTDPRRIVAECAGLLKPGGRLLFSILLSDHLQEFTRLKTDLGCDIPVRFLPRDAIEHALSASDMECAGPVHLHGTNWHKSALDVIKSIVSIGASAIKGEPMSVKELFDFCRKYEERYAGGAGVPATYSALVGVAEKRA
jgi:malonyl-ACP O-methyltransferase BioC